MTTSDHCALSQAKRVALHLARARPDRLMDEMTTELQTVETLSWLIERTETPPFFRLTSVRKASSHSAEQPSGAPGDPPAAAHEKGTIHTKRHSGEDPAKMCGSVVHSLVFPLGAGWFGRKRLVLISTFGDGVNSIQGRLNGIQFV